MKFKFNVRNVTVMSVLHQNLSQSPDTTSGSSGKSAVKLVVVMAFVESRSDMRSHVSQLGRYAMSFQFNVKTAVVKLVLRKDKLNGMNGKSVVNLAARMERVVSKFDMQKVACLKRRLVPKYRFNEKIAAAMLVPHPLPL